MCVRDDSGGSLLGGMLFGGTAPRYHIGWIVVARRARRLGVGAALVRHALDRFVSAPATVDVVTFGAEHPASTRGGARVFYRRLGFQAGELAPRGPDGGTRQHFRLTVERSGSEQQRAQ